MLQSNLIYGIQKKIKENKSTVSDAGMLEENTVLEETIEDTVRAEPILESSFMTGVYEKAAASKKKEEVKKTLVTETFNMTKVEKKLSKDVVYFNYLYENFVPDVFKEQYIELVESIFEDTIKLYQECDVTPRLFSQAVDNNELTESMVIDIYRNGLNENIKNKYTKPLLSGKITELYENEIRDLTKKLIEEGATIDMEHVKVYLPFEESVYQFNRSILIPETAERPIQLFIESMDEDFKQFLQESPEEMLANLEKKIRLLTSMISPEMFGKAVEAEGVEAPKMAGISITIDKNFDGDCDADDGCPDDAVMGDSEAAEELADEEEAAELEGEGSDIAGTEEEVRDEMDLATDTDDLEAEEKAEESAEEETAEHPEQPGAVEMELDMDATGASEGNVPTNDSDLALSGDGEEEGVDPAGEDAQLPGGVEGSASEEVDSDDLGLDTDADDEKPEEELETKEDVSSEASEEEEEEEKEDVSEEKK